MSIGSPNVNQQIDHLFRNQYGKMVSILTAIFGFPKFGDAEDIVQDTLMEAVRKWSYGKLPENPEAWLMLTAKNKALNYLKRENKKEDIEHFFLEKEIEDSQLQMIFACCDPLIQKEDQIAIVLKTLGGFGSGEIAKALLMGEEAVNKRIYRAKQEMKKKMDRVEIPSGEELHNRLKMVSTCLYLLFNEGYNSSSTDEFIRKDFCLEAMGLCKLLMQHFDQEKSLKALLALMCFHVARLEARLDDKGAIIIFEDQDRIKWNKELIEIGNQHLALASEGDELSVYHLEAHIAAQHCNSPNFEATNWEVIFRFYGALYSIKKNPVIKLNLAIITEKIIGLKPGIEALEKLKDEKQLQRYHLLYATLGEFYRKAGEVALAKEAYEQALDLTDSKKEKDLIELRIEGLG